MNALVRGDFLPRPMTTGDLDHVVAIECAVYDFPWTRGNFIDSLAAGYHARVIRTPEGELIAYFVAMKGVDEMHLLNITVAPVEQGKGFGRRMLDEVTGLARLHGADRLWLEVRPSNQRACYLYLQYGFRQIGVRRGYYPALHGKREDANVMSLELGRAHAVD